MSEADEDAIESAWQAVLETWDDEGAHKRFLTLCSATDRLGEAGRRYRGVKDANDERAARAEEQIEKLLGLAMQNLTELKTEPPQKSSKTIMLLVAFGVSATMVVTALWAMLRSF